jgi:hypothetical protein
LATGSFYGLKGFLNVGSSRFPKLAVKTIMVGVVNFYRKSLSGENRAEFAKMVFSVLNTD